MKRGRDEEETSLVNVLRELQHGTALDAEVAISKCGLPQADWDRAAVFALTAVHEPLEKLALLDRWAVPLTRRVNEQGLSLLMMACSNDKWWPMIDTILNRGWADAGWFYITKEGCIGSAVAELMGHAQCHGITSKHLDLMLLLMRHGADWNAVCNGRQLFVCGLQQFKPDIIAFILGLASSKPPYGRHVNVNQVSQMGPKWELTPLSVLCALRYDYVETTAIAYLLLASGANPLPLPECKPQWSALQVATYHANPAMVRVLIPVMRNHMSETKLKSHLKAMSSRITGHHAAADHLQTWLLTHKLGNKLTEHWFVKHKNQGEESLECFWSRLRLLGPLRGFTIGPLSAGQDAAKWRWLGREYQGRLLTNKTLLHVASENNNLMALRELTQGFLVNPFLRDFNRKTAREVATSDEARRLLYAYQQWKPVRACQVWWGPVFLDRCFALMRAIRHVGVPVCADVRKLLVAMLAARHLV